MTVTEDAWRLKYVKLEKSVKYKSERMVKQIVLDGLQDSLLPHLQQQKLQM